MLDFTALNKDVPKSPYTPGNDPANIKVPAELKSEPTGLTAAKARESRKSQDEKSLLDLGKLLNERLGRAELAIHEYFKALRDGQPPEHIALLAARALSLAVSDEMIFTTIARKYQDEYGIRIDPQPPHKVIKEK